MAQPIPENDIKVYVTVIAEYRADGRIIPLTIAWDMDGAEREYTIDRVVDIREAPSQRAGGHGTRYTIQIKGKETYLFYEKFAQKWFVERR